MWCLQVSGKLIDKERTLEEEIQLRERLQLQCRQAERTVDDLTMELQNTNQAKDDLAKQLKLAQVSWSPENISQNLSAQLPEQGLLEVFSDPPLMDLWWFVSFTLVCLTETLVQVSIFTFSL